MIRGIWMVPALLAAPLFCQEAAWRDPSPHRVQMVPVETGVQLEVLDWGGQGRPVVLLAGLGNTAHVFDDFAPKLAANFHVYGITRRGFGESSRPDSGYDAYQLGDDVVAVLDALKLERPVLAGHSIAGEELSSVGTRHPGRAAGLIYLDAIYPYAFANGKGWPMEEQLALQAEIPPQVPPQAADLVNAAALQQWAKKTIGVLFPEAEAHGQLSLKPSTAGAAILKSTKKFAEISGPILALCAFPQDMRAQIQAMDTAEKRAQLQAVADKVSAGAAKQIAAFEAAEAGARVVKIAGANHYVFISNEAQVLDEMNRFVRGLK